MMMMASIGSRTNQVEVAARSLRTDRRVCVVLHWTDWALIGICKGMYAWCRQAGMAQQNHHLL